MPLERVIVVTGASRGIGRGIAVTLAEPGDTVVINFSSSSEAAAETAAERTAAIQADTQAIRSAGGRPASAG